MSRTIRGSCRWLRYVILSWERSLSCLNKENSASNRVVGETSNDSRRGDVVDFPGREDWWADEVLEVALLDVDQGLTTALLVNNLEGDLFAYLVDELFEGTYTGLSGIILDNVVSDLARNPNIGHVLG